MSPPLRTTFDLTPESRWKLEKLTAATLSQSMRIVVADAIDCLYAQVYYGDNDRNFVTAAIKYRYKEQSVE